MKAMLILIHLNVDARERALHKQDFTGVKVFVGFTGVNRIQAEDFKPESGSVRGAMFTSKDEFKQALSGVDAYCRKHNQVENGSNLCTSAFMLTLECTATWSSAEDILEENED